MNSDIDTIEDQVKGSVYHNDSVTFNYQLNDKASKAKLVKGSKRVPFEVEENSTSINLNFSAGAWLTSVLPAIRYWGEIKGDKICKVGDTYIRIGGIKASKDVNGMHVVSQIAFYVDRDKIICHLYNTTQRILVNGHGFNRFVDIFLKPFFEAKVASCAQVIEKLNKEVSQKFAPKTVKRSSVRFKGSSNVVHIFACSQCDSTFKNNLSLNKHIDTIHNKAISFNTSNSSIMPLQHSTRNNSFAATMMLKTTQLMILPWRKMCLSLNVMIVTFAL